MNLYLPAQVQEDIVGEALLADLPSAIRELIASRLGLKPGPTR
ncbi:hypothetical protein [Hyalangium versicolor]|nr:hypothetical protein [Hyalangium versicolor]